MQSTRVYGADIYVYVYTHTYIYTYTYTYTYICREVITQEVGALEALSFMCSSADMTAAKYAQASLLLIIIYMVRKVGYIYTSSTRLVCKTSQHADVC